MENQEFEYIEVEVSRSEVTSVFLKVPKGWKPSGKDYKLIGRAAKETTEDSDWDKWLWEQNVDIIRCKPATEKDALSYSVFDATPYLNLGK
jgi:hypothetical protein